MPVEIRELIIKTNVVKGGHHSNHLEMNTNHSSFLDLKENIIAECIEEILDKLQSKFDR